MWCIYYDHDLFECHCPDIEERLARLAEEPTTGLAARQNIKLRKMMNPSSTEADKETRH